MIIHNDEKAFLLASILYNSDQQARLFFLFVSFFFLAWLYTVTTKRCVSFDRDYRPPHRHKEEDITSPGEPSRWRWVMKTATVSVNEISASTYDGRQSSATHTSNEEVFTEIRLCLSLTITRWNLTIRIISEWFITPLRFCYRFRAVKLLSCSSEWDCVTGEWGKWGVSRFSLIQLRTTGVKPKKLQ